MERSKDPLIGRSIGKYEILAVLGSGGMGTVYRARQTTTRREVAVKTMTVDAQASETQIERFKREADAITALEHPHIIPIYDFGQYRLELSPEDTRDLLYLAMALKNGGNLGDLLKLEQLSLDEVARIVGQIASALDYAHSRQIIHRDLKPANALLDEERNIFLTDFGIARRLGDTKLTAQGMAVGSPTYMSPEAWRAEEPSAETDVYSLGVLAFEMLAGQPPFTDRQPTRLMLKHVTEPPPLLRSFRPDLSEYIELVINQALAKDRQNRFRTAGEFAMRLKVAIGMPPVNLEAPVPVVALTNDMQTSLSRPTEMKMPPAAEQADAPGRATRTAGERTLPARARLRLTQNSLLLPTVGVVVLLLLVALLLIITR